MPKDRLGNKLTWRKFISRWKEGIEGITPSQRIKTQLNGTRIILLGLLLGLVASIIAIKNMWWVTIILIGASINTGVQYLGLRQQVKAFEEIEKYMVSTEEIEGEVEDYKEKEYNSSRVGEILA